MYTTPAPLKPSVADTDGTDASRDENRVFRTVRSTSYRQPPLFRSKRSRSQGEGRRERRETTNVAWKPEEQGVLVIERGLPAICLSLKLQRLPPKAAEFRTGEASAVKDLGVGGFLLLFVFSPSFLLSGCSELKASRRTATH